MRPSYVGWGGGPAFASGPATRGSTFTNAAGPPRRTSLLRTDRLGSSSTGRHTRPTATYPAIPRRRPQPPGRGETPRGGVPCSASLANRGVRPRCGDTPELVAALRKRLGRVRRHLLVRSGLESHIVEGCGQWCAASSGGAPPPTVDAARVSQRRSSQARRSAPHRNHQRVVLALAKTKAARTIPDRGDTMSMQQTYQW